MSLAHDLRKEHWALWQRVVMHPFVLELGDNTLPIEKFRVYLLQDYVFVRELVSMTALGISKAPNLEAAGVLNQFLAGILNPEKNLFAQAFKQLGVPEKKFSTVSATPTTQAFGDFLVRIGLEGDFNDIITVLYITEGTYLDWATRLLKDGKRPGNPLYREWIDIHGPDVLGRLVDWIFEHLSGSYMIDRRTRIERLFLTALRYEYWFWEAAYYGDYRPK